MRRAALRRRLVLLAATLIALSPAAECDLSASTSESATLSWFRTDVSGNADFLVYLPSHGYGAPVPIASVRPNLASYGLRLNYELRPVRIPRLVFTTRSLLLLGDSGGSNSASYNARPMTILFSYGAGTDITSSLQFRILHQAWHDISGPANHAQTSTSFSFHYGRSANNFAELLFYPPRNEYDPSPALPFADRVVARYALEAGLRSPLRSDVFIFAHPLFFLGNSRPQVSYNYSAKPIGVQLEYGVGFAIRPSLELRLSRGEWRDLGGYEGDRQLWTGLSLRYHRERLR